MMTYIDELNVVKKDKRFLKIVIFCLVIILILSNICTFVIAKMRYGKLYGQCLEEMGNVDQCCATSKKCMSIRWQHL